MERPRQSKESYPITQHNDLGIKRTIEHWATELPTDCKADWPQYLVTDKRQSFLPYSLKHSDRGTQCEKSVKVKIQLWVFHVRLSCSGQSLLINDFYTAYRS